MDGLPIMTSEVLVVVVVVVCKQNFIHPNDPNHVHTQSIESLWKRAKRKLRDASGTSEALFPSYVSEVMWCHRK